MIQSAEEFVRLCLSRDTEEINQTLWDDAPLEVWIEIIERHPDKRIDVAQNRTIPDEVMRLLAICGDANSRSIIAEKRRLAVDLFPVLAKDLNESVRSKIAGNRKTPLEILEILSTDPVEHVAKGAQYNLRERVEKNKKSKE